MSELNWDFDTPEAEALREFTRSVHAKMETGNTGPAREALAEYAKQYPEQAETLRLSLVRKFGTGL